MDGPWVRERRYDSGEVESWHRRGLWPAPPGWRLVSAWATESDSGVSVQAVAMWVEWVTLDADGEPEDWLVEALVVDDGVYLAAFDTVGGAPAGCVLIGPDGEVTEDLRAALIADVRRDAELRRARHERKRQEGQSPS